MKTEEINITQILDNIIKTNTPFNEKENFIFTLFENNLTEKYKKAQQVLDYILETKFNKDIEFVADMENIFSIMLGETIRIISKITELKLSI